MIKNIFYSTLLLTIFILGNIKTEEVFNGLTITNPSPFHIKDLTLNLTKDNSSTEEKFSFKEIPSGGVTLLDLDNAKTMRISTLTCTIENTPIVLNFGNEEAPLPNTLALDFQQHNNTDITPHLSLSITKENIEKEIMNAVLPIILDAYAPWCGPCRTMTPIIMELEKEFEGRCIFAKLNTTQEPELCKQYDITLLPTFIFFKNGKVITKHEGAMPKEAFRKEIEKFLESSLEVSTIDVPQTTKLPFYKRIYRNFISPLFEWLKF